MIFFIYKVYSLTNPISLKKNIFACCKYVAVNEMQFFYHWLVNVVTFLTNKIRRENVKQNVYIKRHSIYYSRKTTAVFFWGGVGICV